MSDAHKPQLMPAAWLPVWLRHALKRITPQSWRDHFRFQALTEEKKYYEALQDAFVTLTTTTAASSPWQNAAAFIADTVDSTLEADLISYLETFSRAAAGATDQHDVTTREQFAAATNEAAPTLLSVRGWLNINYLCFRNRLVAESYGPRARAVARAYHDASVATPTADALLTASRAAIDQGDAPKAKAFTDQYQAHESATGAASLTHYLAAVFGHETETHGERDMATDETFRALLQGKSVAIVGPAASDAKVGPEIDSFDVVIRPNYLGDTNRPDPDIFGSRTDVSYYNSEHCEKVHLSGQAEHFNDLRYMAFPYNQYSFQKPIFWQGKARVFSRNPHFFNGVPNMIQCIVHDILPFDPSRVKIFNTNFYLSKQLYYGSYTSQHKLLLPTLAEHDLVSQLNYIRNLWRAGVVEADEACEFVLGLPAKEYMERIDAVHIRPQS